MRSGIDVLRGYSTVRAHSRCWCCIGPHRCYRAPYCSRRLRCIDILAHLNSRAAPGPETPANRIGYPRNDKPSKCRCMLRHTAPLRRPPSLPRKATAHRPAAIPLRKPFFQSFPLFSLVDRRLGMESLHRSPCPLCGGRRRHLKRAGGSAVSRRKTQPDEGRPK